MSDSNPSGFFNHRDAMNDFMNVQNRTLREAAIHQQRLNNPVIPIMESLREYIATFESELDQDHEVGAWLASFGNSMLVHVSTIGFSKPNLVTFHGVTTDGNKVQLIQHVSQLSFLLQSVAKLNSSEPPRRIGFITD